MIMIGMVIVNNMASILSKQNDADYEAFIKKLEDSACMYVDIKYTEDRRRNCKTNNNCSVSVDEIINAGYVEDNLKDPNTKQKIVDNKNKYKVNIRWVNNVKTCKVNG